LQVPFKIEQYQVLQVHGTAWVLHRIMHTDER
jgi:hypothetical protein